jgi:ATP phosphoribosyltransferase regulatory subunit
MEKDIFSRSKKIFNILSVLRNHLISDGFWEFFPDSIVKYNENIESGLKFSDGKDFYLLNPDVTSWIISEQKANIEEKFFYITKENDGVNSKLKLGIEIIGIDNPEEIILNLLYDFMNLLGIDNFYIDLSSIKKFEEIIKENNLEKKEFFKALEKRDIEYFDNLKVAEEVKEKIDEIINYRENKTDYEPINEILEKFNNDNIFVDYGTLKYMNYYDDLVFELYTDELGYAIVNGGNYYINNEKSCGMAIDLNLIEEILRRREK